MKFFIVLTVLAMNTLNLKEYSVIVTKPFYNQNRMILKKLLPKFQLIPIIYLQVMQDYVH